MQNPYYHEFEPNILTDAWFWFAIGITVLAFALGYWFYYLKEGVKYVDISGLERFKPYQTPKIKARLKQSIVNGLFLVLVTVFSVMLARGSGNGIVQFFDNHLMKNESAVWSLIMAALAVLAVDFVMYVIWLVSFCLGATIKHSKLERQKNRIMRQKRAAARKAQRDQVDGIDQMNHHNGNHDKLA